VASDPSFLGNGALEPLVSAAALSMPNRELVVYVLYILGGDTRKVHTEDVAVKCHELFPDAFSWAKYPQFPDKDIVRVALTDARKVANGAHVEGRAGQGRGLPARSHRQPVVEGWQLTDAGVRWVTVNLHRLEDLEERAEVKEHRQDRLRELARIRRHPAFVRYKGNPEGFVPAIGEIAELLKCRVDTEPEIWSGRFQKARRQAGQAGQKDVLEFVAMCEAVVSRESI